MARFTVADFTPTFALTDKQFIATKYLAQAMPLYEWDDTKRALNRSEHGVDFAAAEGFDWTTAALAIDDRENYGELRERALGFIGIRLYVLVFTRRGDRIRIISLRRANKKDIEKYEE